MTFVWRPGRLAAIVLALGVTLASLPCAVGADPVEQSGARLELLGSHDLGGNGLHADVWLHHHVAYVGTSEEGSDRLRGCPGTGVKVVDLADPARPALVGHLAQHPGTSAEVIRVRAVDTPTFRGDLLAVGLQACRPDGLRGLDLWDVTDPRTPQHLSFFEVIPAEADLTGGVHELDLVQRPDGRVLALLTVPLSEARHPEHLGDLRIVEVTDPRAPRPLADWGARATLGLENDQGQGIDLLVRGHGVRASADGMRAYASYWDAGVAILDLADPAAPRLLGRTGFAPDEEGNAHSIDLAYDERVMVEADEVLVVNRQLMQIEGPPNLAGSILAGGALPAPPWNDTTSVTADLVDIGRGCPAGDWTADFGPAAHLDVADPYPDDPRGRIVLFERGFCPVATRLDGAKAAGAVGAVVVNTSNRPFAPFSGTGPLGAKGISRTDGDRLRAELAAGQPVRVTLAGELVEYQDFGGLRFWDIADPARPLPIGTFRTESSRVDRTAGPATPGLFTAHNPIVRGDLLFVSWYSDGVRVVDIHDPAAPRELAAWTPPARAIPDAVRISFTDGPLIWGIAVEGDLIVASEMNGGLYVLQLVR
jgi:hypothetical protein